MKKAGKNFSRTVDMWDELQDHVNTLYSRNDRFHVLADGTFSIEKNPTEEQKDETYRKRLRGLKNFLRKLGADGRILANALPARGSRELTFPPENLIFPE